MITCEEKEKFEKICREVRSSNHTEAGIGTYKEKTLHSVLKSFMCDDRDMHEVGIGNFVADAMVDNTLIEVQTGGFYPLKKKLEYYLTKTDKKIKIVCPMAAQKRVIWISPESGELSKPRKTGVASEKKRILRQLYWLIDVIDFDRVEIDIFALSVDDMKFTDGRGKDRKVGATKLERLPRELIDIIKIRSRADISSFFLPKGLPEVFSVKDAEKHFGMRGLSLYSALKVLIFAGAISQPEKVKGKNIYTKK